MGDTGSGLINQTGGTNSTYTFLVEACPERIVSMVDCSRRMPWRIQGGAVFTFTAGGQRVDSYRELGPCRSTLPAPGPGPYRHENAGEHYEPRRRFELGRSQLSRRPASICDWRQASTVTLGLAAVPRPTVAGSAVFDRRRPSTGRLPRIRRRELEALSPFPRAPQRVNYGLAVVSGNIDLLVTVTGPGDVGPLRHRTGKSVGDCLATAEGRLI